MLNSLLKPLLSLILTLLLGQPLIWSQVVQLPTGLYRVTEHSSFSFFDSLLQAEIYIDTPAVSTAADFRMVFIDVVQYGEKAAVVVFNERGTAAVATATRQAIGKQMALIVDGKLVSVPIIRDVIRNGRLQIVGHGSNKELTKLVERLNQEIPKKNRKTKAAIKEEVALLQACYLLDSALVHRDTLLLYTVLHPMVTMGHSNGWIENKAEMLSSVGTGTSSYEDITEHGYVTVNIEGEIANLRRQLKVKGIFKGHPYDVDLNVLEVWVKDRKQWQLFARQSISQ